jgi:methylated-DNA-[protein]-cysteine S-methyltransferase
MITSTDRDTLAGATRYTFIESPLGALFVTRDDEGITSLLLPTGRHGPQQRTPHPDWQRVDAAFEDIRAQLGEYFAGTRTEFDLPLHLLGTPFQLRVWAALREIPCGVTTSYGRLAESLDSPGAARAVGLANGQNPVSIIVGCHRVIGANGSLTGYGGGLPAKRWLLAHEAQQTGLFAL